MGTGASGSLSMWNRMVRAAKLDVDLYEEVEADTGANGQAFAVVLLVSVASGIGWAIAGAIDSEGIWILWGFLIGIATSIVGWLVWAAITYWIGSTIFKGPETEATYGQLLRTLGFAQSPGVLRVLVFIPFLGGLISFAVWVWVLVAGVIAVRQALDFSTGRAIGTVVVGWLVMALIGFLVAWAVGGTAALS
jgi:hypothetical protein